EVAYLSGNFEPMEIWAKNVLKHAQTTLDKVKIYEIQITAYASQNRLPEGIKIGLQALKLLGITFPESPNSSDFQKGLEEVMSSSIGKNPSAAINLPEMNDPQKLAMMSILSSLFAPVFISSPELMPLLVLEKVKLSIQSGNSPWSAFAYGVYGVILCGVVGDIESGYQFGSLALSLLDKFNPKAIQARTLDMVEGFVIHWKDHAQEAIAPLQWGYQCGVESGEFEWAGYTAFKICQYSLFIGQELTALEQEMRVWSQDLTRLQQNMGVNLVEVTRQTALNLINPSDNPDHLSGEAIEEERLLPIYLENNNGYGLHYFYLNKLILCYLFEEFDQAIVCADQAAKYLGMVAAALAIPVFHFYDSLSQLALYPYVERSQQDNILEKVAANQAKMGVWAVHAPMNYQHKLDLVAAEICRVQRHKAEAMELYDQAIAQAKANNYIQEEALANELAARFYLDWGKKRVAADYMQEAYYCYARWGALAKTQQLEKKYPQLLSPILQQTESSLSSRTSTQGLTTGTAVTQSSILDLTSAIEASRSLSEELELEPLISKLMHIVLKTAGADHGVLILNNSETWEIAAQCDIENCHLQTLVLNDADSDSLPSGIINTVKRTKQSLLLNTLEQNNDFIADSYFIKHHPKSLLCTPILNQGKLISILYLENNLTVNAFTPERIEVLNLLTAQAAISIENSRLYQNLEVQVQQRTQHLEQTLEQLQQTQTQLIQTEKMSSLGQIVAGIAHEVNNPITFISGNIYHTREYCQDLLDLIAVYQENVPDPNSAIQEKIEEIELEFLKEDLENLLNSMQTGSDRVRKIIIGLRNFSRLDEAEKKEVDIHEGIENTLLILHHRLEANDSYPEIAILKNYGQLPPLNCYANQLNQVFLQILTNAIDILRTFKEQNSPEIKITTELKDSQTVRIQITDNGSGMSENTRERIFDPFFTTKPIGQGTGLGLSMSYQIITEQHSGTITCNSTLGEGSIFTITLPIA
ncbi:MAG: ATP-binding protein, partial [Cyanobacteriota bacterium]|nr:ATP-binding protein [Cyanobacteriota bacterium]